jgi:hypothetical protein
MSDAILIAVDKLLQSICDDDVQHGGLLSRQTIRCADELRLLVAGERHRRPGAAPESRPEPPRSRRPL